MFETNYFARDARFPVERDTALDDALIRTAWDLQPLLWIADQLDCHPLAVLQRGRQLGLHDLKLEQ